MMVNARCLLAVVLVLATALPLEAVTVKTMDPPSTIPQPGPPTPDEDGNFVQDVVNVQKDVIIIVYSRPEQFTERQHARDTWMQPLNRSSEFCLAKADRRSVSVWFAVPTVSQPGLKQAVVAEGKKNGDIIEIQSNSTQNTDDFTNFGAVVRWARVAYYKRFKTLLFTNVDSFVSIYNLLPLVREINDPYFYGGFVNSYEPNKDLFVPQKYYAPFVESGTILLGYEAIELISRELEFIKHLSRFDATIGNFFMPFEVIKPTFDNRFVAKKENLYSELEKPIVINHMEPEEMEAFSKPKCLNGVCQTPPMPAQTKELRSTYVYVNPIPSGEEPLCNGVDGAKCNMNALKSLMPK